MKKIVLVGTSESNINFQNTNQEKVDVILTISISTPYLSEDDHFAQTIKGLLSTNFDSIVITCDISYQLIREIRKSCTKNIYWFHAEILYRIYPDQKGRIRCNRCVMDNISDLTIGFDQFGNCDYCNDQLLLRDKIYFPNRIGQKKLSEMVKKIKKPGNIYDCIIGLSGGLDSSYLTYLAYKLGLNAICVHVDDGFYTDTSKHNIQKLIEATGFKLITIYPDPVQYYALLKAYFKAGVAHLYLPQDNIIFACLFQYSKEYNIRSILSGFNYSFECIAQRSDEYGELDLMNILDIHKRFGTEPIDKLCLLSEEEFIRYKKEEKIETFAPLNYTNYQRSQAFNELSDFCNFKYYGGKHQENIFTAFNLLYWCPHKFNIDYRTNYLSSLIISGQISRSQALKSLSKPLYVETAMKNYIDIIKKKLNISDEEFENYMQADIRYHFDYCTQKPDVDIYAPNRI